MSGGVSQTGVNNLFWTGTVLWVVLWASFVARLTWLNARLRSHLIKHHAHRWRRLPWTARLTWSVWFVFQSREDYGDPIIGAQRRAMLTVFYDMLLVLAAMIVWFVFSAALMDLAP